MKKTLAMLLALTTVMSMSAVSFATVSFPSDDSTLANSMTAKFAKGDYVYYENNDGDMEAHVLTGDSITVNPGKVVYIPLRTADGKYIGSESKDEAKKVKVYTDWTVGKTDAPSVAYKKLPLEGGSDTYVYAVAVTMPENSATKAYDLCGTLTLGKSKSSGNEVAVNFEVKYGVAYADSTDYPTGTIDVDYAAFSGTVEENFPVVDFGDGDDEDEIEWGDDDLALFTVNTTDQSKVNLDWSTKYNAEFAAKYPDANIDFVSFTQKPSFNKTGVMTLYADANTYLYEIAADGTAKEVKGAEYDEGEEAFLFKTRVLGSYAISDVELDLTVSASSEETSAPTDGSTATDSSKPNPDTGR